MAEASGSRVKFGVMGRSYPPMDHILGTMTRAEEQGWDFINFPDQIPGLFPEGSVPLSASPPDDETLPVSSMTNIWMGSFEMITAAAVLTERMGIQLGVIDLLRRSPAIFAQEAVTVSHISKGRARWCIGSGEAKQFLPYGEGRSKAVTRMEDALRTIHALWQSGGGPVNRESQFYPLTQAVLPQPLYDGKKPPIYMVGVAQKVLKLTAELANGWMTTIPRSCARSSARSRR
jgi:phthiodiolone/phenolphthiodiolone dimycocerosates ketoreductase